MLDWMKASPFPRKYSVQFVGRSGKVSQPFYFFQHGDHETSCTWQVRRSEFDQALLENARQAHEAVAQDDGNLVDVAFAHEQPP